MANIPTNKSTQAVTIIKELIASGEWKNYLPSERALAKQLLISRSSLRLALEILTHDGIITVAEQSKRRQIVSVPDLKKTKQLSRKKAIFFTPVDTATMAPMVYEQVAKLREFLAKSDILLEIISSPVFKNNNTSCAPLENLIDNYPDAHWILHQCPIHIQRWFDNNYSFACILGTSFLGVKLPSFGFDLRGTARHAAGKLLSLGHKRIGLIRFRSHLAGDDDALEGIHEAIQSSQISDIPAPVVLSHNFHVERLIKTLDNLFLKPKPPTAFIIINHHHFLSVFSHLLSRGVSIPEKVSLISLTNHSTLACLSPSPACYTNSDRVLKRISNFIINGSTHKEAEPTLIIPELLLGKTIAKPFDL